MKNLEVVSLAGSGPSLIGYFTLPGVPVWAVPRASILLHEKGYKIDAVFQLDDFGLKERALARQDKYRVPMDTEAVTNSMKDEWIFGATSPDTRLYMANKCMLNDFPHINAWPMNDMCNYFGTDYILDSGTFMLAAAIYKQPKEIHLHGYDYTPDERNPDRSEHAMCFGYWLGRCEEFGIDVKINPYSRAMGKLQYMLRGHKSRGIPLAALQELDVVDKQKLDDFYISKKTQIAMGEAAKPQPLLALNVDFSEMERLHELGPNPLAHHDWAKR